MLLICLADDLFLYYICRTNNVDFSTLYVVIAYQSYNYHDH